MSPTVFQTEKKGIIFETVIILFINIRNKWLGWVWNKMFVSPNLTERPCFILETPVLATVIVFRLLFFALSHYPIIIQKNKQTNQKHNETIIIK